jgi:archaellum component FlaC
MYYCNNCDIAYEDKKCPLCDAKEEINRLEKEIEDLNNQE